MYIITVNEGPLTADDNATYYCVEEAEFSMHIIGDEEVGEKRLVFVDFVPTNGSRRGHLHRVPFERIVKIVVA